MASLSWNKALILQIINKISEKQATLLGYNAWCFIRDIKKATPKGG